MWPEEWTTAPQPTTPSHQGRTSSKLKYSPEIAKNTCQGSKVEPGITIFSEFKCSFELLFKRTYSPGKKKSNPS
jgi:hypothetical protein